MNNGFLHTVEEVAESGIPESYWEPLWRKVERMEKHWLEVNSETK